ncbi:L-lactate MFS transporter [Edaphobacter aggregans]|uniref:L-lactate MFS transporter n=1 Tax=Edaphobacter aggregans TaxID=570835 RepID=UPI000551AEBF|nr:OFA family MFS transporter [Edaphobacter aggregans]
MKTNRWGIALAGVVLQVVLGSVYAWSVFRTPLTRQSHWSISQVTLTFTISIIVLGFAAFFGGLWLPKAGPRTVAVTGSILYGLGTFLASLSGNRLWVLYTTYGVIGGIGLGFAYIVPVAVLVKWFPDRRGLITGVAVGGFGAGALITAPVATHLMARIGVLHTFAALGIAYAILGVLASLFMRNPAKDWKPDGWVPSAALTAQRSAANHTLGEALRTWQWWALWTILFLNTCSGISLISQESPVFQELAKVTVIVAAGMVGIVSIGNAVGRVFWAWVSDLLSRRMTFIITFLLQVALFWFLPEITSAATLTPVAFLILMCYGGGFGTMPAFAADYFGSANVGSIYGLMLTSWGAASAFGPLLVAHMRQTNGNYSGGFHALALIVLVATIIPFAIRPPARREHES